jgi:hypothetical protein
MRIEKIERRLVLSHNAARANHLCPGDSRAIAIAEISESYIANPFHRRKKDVGLQIEHSDSKRHNPVFVITVLKLFFSSIIVIKTVINAAQLPLPMFQDAVETDRERRVVADHFFQQAIRIGRPREYHTEGNLGAHISHILTAIDNVGKPAMRRDLRLSALLHDVGKFAFLCEREEYMPDLTADEKSVFCNDSVRFRQEFQYPEAAIDPFIPEHALVSHQYAKQFVSDHNILDLIKYHDTYLKIYDIRHTPAYGKDLITRYYGDKDPALYVLFSYVDSATRSKNVTLWMQQELQCAGLLEKRIV